MPEVGIVMTLNDKVSSALKTIAGNAKAFDKTLDELEAGLQGLGEAQNGLVAKQTELKKALAESTVKVSEAQRSYKKLKDEASKGALDAAIEEQTRLQQELKNTEQELKLNSKAYDGLYNSALNAAKGMQKTKLETKDFAKGIRDSGLLREFGSALSGAAGAFLTSAIGEPTAQLVSQAIGGAMSGAAAGAFLGPLGMAGGAALGGAAGLISGGTAIWQAKDDAFKSYVQESVEGQLSEMDSIRASGSVIAAGRENDLRVFSTLLDGNTDAARRFQESLIELGRTPPFSYDTVSALSKDMLGLGLSTEDAIDRINTLAGSAAALGWSESSVSTVISYLESAQLAGKMDSRVVKSLSKMGVNAYEALAGEFSISEDKVLGSLGDLDVNRAVDAIYTYLGKQFADAADGLKDTYAGASGILESYQEDLNAMMGEGYNEARKAGIQEQSDWLESGQLEEAYKAIGAWQAELENAKERYIREAVDAAIDSDDYKAAQAEGDAAEMGRIIMQAKIRGMNEYNANEGKDEVLAQELALIEGVREDTALNQSYWDAGYTLGQAFSMGRAAGMSDEYYAAAVSINAPVSTRGSGHAYGLDRVPYDNYPALLHEGERVLTAREARAQDAARPSIVINVTGNTFGAGTEEEAAAFFAQRLADQLELHLAAGGGR